MGLFGTVDSYDNKGPVGGATNPLTGAALARDRENQRAILELDGTQAYENITILDGSISPKRAEIIVDTEGGASADTLEAILTNTDGSTTLHDGMKLTLRSADPSRSVTVKHRNAEFGIQMVDGQDVILGTKWGLKLKLVANKWFEDQGRAEILAEEALGRTAPTTADSLGIMQVGNGLSVSNGIVSVIPQVGHCFTAEDDPNKVVGIPGFTLSTHATIIVGFAKSNKAPNPTLNVSGTGAKPIIWPGKNMEINPYISTYRLQFVFDGSSWYVVGEPEEPVGTIKIGFYASVPLYLPMNGSAVSRTTYAALFNLLGTRFGVGDGSTTFNLPDTRNKVLQGNSRYGLSFESREAGLPNITGRIGKTWTNAWTLPTLEHYAGAIRNGAVASTAVPSGVGAAVYIVPYYDDFNASWSNNTYGKSNTVQMDAVTVNAFIKY